MLKGRLSVAVAVILAAVLMVAFWIGRTPKDAAVPTAVERAPASRNDRAPREFSDSRREVSQLRRAVQQIEVRSSAIERGLAELAARDSKTTTEPVEQAEFVPETNPEPKNKFEEHFRYADGYRAYVVGEPRDSAWASEKEAELKTFFEAEGFKGYSLQSFECKSTVCQVELRSDGAPDPANDPGSVRQYLGRRPFSSQSYWAPTEDGLVVVMSRDGYELPNPTSL